MLTGCDVVFGIDPRRTDADASAEPPNPFESTTHDEDGDGTADAFDLCPHVNPNRERDSDGDGIGDDCDPRIDTPDRRLFFSFADGDIRRLTPTGIFETDVAGDAVVLGADSDALSYLTVDGLDASTADVVLHLTFVDAALPMGTYSEVGIASFHRDHSDNRTGRGDICFVGTDANFPPNYLEFDEDATDLDSLTKRFEGLLVDTTVTLAHHATPAGFGCELVRANGSISNAHVRTTPRTQTGTVAIDTVRLAAKLHYLWVVVPGG